MKDELTPLDRRAAAGSPISGKRISKLDKNVSPLWRPVKGLDDQRRGLSWSDRIWYWLVSLSGIAMAAAGVAIIACLHMKHLGCWLIGAGFVVFLLGSPSMAARNGYRDVW
jgi:hypothetical protein